MGVPVPAIQYVRVYLSAHVPAIQFVRVIQFAVQIHVHVIPIPVARPIPIPVPVILCQFVPVTAILPVVGDIIGIRVNIFIRRR